MTPKEFKEKFCTPSYPKGDVMLLVVEIERLQANLNEATKWVNGFKNFESLPKKTTELF